MKSHEYNIGIVKRACGHNEDIGTIKSSCGYEPTAKKYEEQKLCKTCGNKRFEDLRSKTEAMKQKAIAYCREHNISEAEANITAYDTNAEIMIYIK